MARFCAILYKHIAVGQRACSYNRLLTATTTFLPETDVTIELLQLHQMSNEILNRIRTKNCIHLSLVGGSANVLTSF